MSKRQTVRLMAGVAALALAGCDDFTPQTGPLQSCGAATTATTSYSLYGPSTTPTACQDSGATFTTSDAGLTGKVIIADQLNNRVVVSHAGVPLWVFGDGTSVPSPTSIVAPNDVEFLPAGAGRVNAEVLTAGTGAPVAAESGCAANDAGICVDDRVIIVDYPTKAIVWTFGGHDGSSDAGVGQLSGPTCAVLVPTSGGDHVLITDQNNNRIVEVDRGTSTTVWTFPPSNPTVSQRLTTPQSAERLANGNTLIADQGGNRVVEVSPSKDVVWQYPMVVNAGALSSPAFASRLPNGHTLIADSDNWRVLEVDNATPANVVWTYQTGTHASSGEPVPTGAVRLANGHTLVTEITANRVIEIDETPQQNIVYSLGGFAQIDGGPHDLNQPYNAKVTTDTTGLTPPLPDASTTP